MIKPTLRHIPRHIDPRKNALELMRIELLGGMGKFMNHPADHKPKVKVGGVEMDFDDERAWGALQTHFPHIKVQG